MAAINLALTNNTHVFGMTTVQNVSEIASPNNCIQNLNIDF